MSALCAGCSGETYYESLWRQQFRHCPKVKWVCDNLALSCSWSRYSQERNAHRGIFKLNSAGQVPTVQSNDGRTLGQSNAIIHYLARGSNLIPTDAFAVAKR